VRSGGQLGESGEYRTGRLRVVCVHIRSFESGSPCLCRLRTASVGPCCNKHWVVYWRIWDLWGPANLVALTVAELDDTPLYFTDDIGIVFEPSTDYPSRFLCGRWHLGMVGPAQLFDSHRERWSLVLPSWLTCVVLPDWYLAMLYYIHSNLCDTLGYGWGLFAVSKRISAISPCSYEIYG
jgi:hypothetical protein